MERYTAEGEAAFTPRSRRPHTSPTRLPQTTIDLIIDMPRHWPAKASTTAPTPSPGTCNTTTGCTCRWPRSTAIYARPDSSTPSRKNGPKSSYIRFAAEQPNERWQADFTHWWLANGTHIEILCWIDDHARYAVSVTAHRRVTGPIVLAEFRKAYAAKAFQPRP